MVGGGEERGTGDLSGAVSKYHREIAGCANILVEVGLLALPEGMEIACSEECASTASTRRVLAAPASSAAVSDPTGATAAAAAGLNAVGLSKKLLGKGPTLEDLKKSISTDLRQLQLKSPTLRFLTIIDDTDRLEPIEAVEVLRLIRKVADFPLITYLVCFDRDVLVQQVEHACGVHNGDHFIEKIFQNVITVPPQEPFALRSYLRRLFKSKFADTLTLYSDDRDASYREHLVLDVWVGKFLRTPRDVVRLYEAVKLGWPHVPARTDFWDFVWLQLVKLKCTDLYEWTQNYLMEIDPIVMGVDPVMTSRLSKAKS